MPTSNSPLWVPLVSAAVGLTGGLVTTVLTQGMTRRRDDARWERERADRREQWRREDAARWLADRRAAYAELLTALDEEHTAAAALGNRPPRAHDPEVAALAALKQAADRARHAVDLIAPEDVVRLAGDLAGLIRATTDHAAGMPGRGGPSDPDAVAAAFAALRAAMRTGLASDGPGNASGQRL